MKSLITWFIKNPVAANLIMFAMVAAGFLGLNNLEREFVPATDVFGMTITASWPGASPSDVEEQLLVRIEEAVDGLDGIDYVESSGREGSGTVSIFTKQGIDYEKMLDQVNSSVDAINNLPADSFRPEVRRSELRLDIFRMALYGNVDTLTLQRAATDLRFKITQLPGFQLTEQSSKVAEQVTIEVSEEQLRKYNMTFNQVSAAISGASINLSAGTVDTSAGSLQLRARALANTQEEFENIILRQASGGGLLRVKDIATVIDGFDDNKFSSKFRGEPAAIFVVKSPDTLNITQAGRALRAFTEEINQTLPPDLKFAVWEDQSRTFDSRMSLIGNNALSGMALVLIILMLFLRPKVAIWVTVGIGAAFLGALAIAPYLGITLNMISLFAFLLVTGIVVDDAIVVGESIHFHTENGLSGETSAIAGTNMVVKPVYFAVITTILMFVPFMLLSGAINAMTSQISLVVIAVLTFSLIEAFFILPAHLRHLEPVDHAKPKNALFKFQDKIANSLVVFAQKVFRPVIAALMRARYYTFATFIGLFILSIGLLTNGVAPSAFLPEVQGDSVSVNARFPEGTNFERINQVRQQIDQGILDFNANVEQDFGVNVPLITRPGTQATSRQVEAFLGLTNDAVRNNIATKAIADKLEEYVGTVPDAFSVSYDYSEGHTGGFPGVRFGIVGNDADAMRAAVVELKAELESYSSVQTAFDSLEGSAAEVQFNLKPGAESLGLTLADVTGQVRAAFFGVEVQRLPRNGEDVRVMVRYPLEARESIDSLKDLRIRAPNGVEVPVYSIADVSFEEGVGFVRRRDRARQEWVGARVRGEQSEISKVKADIEANFMPAWEARHPGIRRIALGEDEEQEDFQKEMTNMLIIVMFLMYGLLAIAFKSYAQPLLIMIAIPFALVGMIFGNIVTGVPFGIMSLFGFFAASGVAINDNLVLIDYVNRLRAKGVGAYQAMLDACVSRFRPILLTSVTTFVGITPILFETSPQAGFLKPMVVALAFGVLFDFFLTLMLVPALYCIGVDIKRSFKSIWTGEKQPPLGSRYDPNMSVAIDGISEDMASNPKTGAALGGQPAE